MKKIIIFICCISSIILGSEQNTAQLSDYETAQLLVNVKNLPEECLHKIMPEYCPQLLALVYLKKIPSSLKKALNQDVHFVTRGINNLQTYYKKNRLLYFLYSSHNNELKKPLWRLGPNKNGMILLNNYLFDFTSFNVPYIQETGDGSVSSFAVNVNEHFSKEHAFKCMHPFKNIFVGMEPAKTKEPKITVSRYDQARQTFDVKSYSVPVVYKYLAYNKQQLAAEALWGIDSDHKLWLLEKNKERYDAVCFKLKYKVDSILQSHNNPELLLINGTNLYKITEQKTLQLIKTFTTHVTFLQKKDSLTAHQENIIQDSAIVIDPLKPMFNKAQSRVDDYKKRNEKVVHMLTAFGCYQQKTNLKQRILDVFKNREKSLI
ncbi:MAG: hypothetical protein ACOYT8_03850 [Candidatus Dependentiae bacterium]